MRRQAALIGAFALAMAAGAGLHAQTSRRAPHVGVLVPGTEAAYRRRIAALLRGLSERGYVDPETLELTFRFADGQVDRLPALARELVAAKPDLIVTSSSFAIRATMAATATIPIVCSGASDLVGLGLVAGLSRPGGNVTGLTQQWLDLRPKQIELLAECIPGIARLSVLATGSTTGGSGVLEATVAAAATYGIEARALIVDTIGEIEAAFAAMATARIQAVLLFDAPLLNSHRELIVGLAAKLRVPLMAQSREYVDLGAFASYGPDIGTLNYRAAYFVDRILKGAKPGDLPVEQPRSFELLLNLRTARLLGLAIPPLLLARADEVIE